MVRIVGADKHGWSKIGRITADQLAGTSEHLERVPIGTVHAVDPASGRAACGVEPRETFPATTWPPGPVDFATPCEECTKVVALE